MSTTVTSAAATHIARARLAKAQKLAEAILDDWRRDLSVSDSPVSRSLLASALRVFKSDDSWWQNLAARVGVREPSADTRALVAELVEGVRS